MYTTQEEFAIATGYTVDLYATREKLAVIRLTDYCRQFPLESEMSELTAEQQDSIKNAIYFQIVYEYDNNLLNSNGEDIASVTIGGFSYNKGMTYKGKGDTGITPYSKTALAFMREADICDNGVAFPRKKNWWEC